VGETSWRYEGQEGLKGEGRWERREHPVGTGGSGKVDFFCDCESTSFLIVREGHTTEGKAGGEERISEDGTER